MFFFLFHFSNSQQHCRSVRKLIENCASYYSPFSSYSFARVGENWGGTFWMWRRANSRTFVSSFPPVLPIPPPPPIVIEFSKREVCFPSFSRRRKWEIQVFFASRRSNSAVFLFSPSKRETPDTFLLPLISTSQLLFSSRLQGCLCRLATNGWIREKHFLRGCCSCFFFRETDGFSCSGDLFRHVPLPVIIYVHTSMRGSKHI